MNNVVVLDSKQQFALLYKEICTDYYTILPTRSELFKKGLELKWNPLILMLD
jgi:hypothetical protein